MRIMYEPSSDFVSKTMKRIYVYEDSKKPNLKRVRICEVFQRYALALSGALFGIFNATRVF
jgi:hypothetical protein